MKMKVVAVLTVLVIALSATSYAQHKHTPAPASATDAAVNPMQDCQKHHAEGVAALDEAEASLSKLKEESLSVEARAAIDSAKQQITAAKHHLSMCPMSEGQMMGSGGMNPNLSPEKMKCMSKSSKSE